MRLVIIGGYGKMGRWFARLLKGEGFDVTIIGRDAGKLAETARQIGTESSPDVSTAAMADAVIISVPVDSFETVCRDLAPYTRPDQYIFDLTSVKEKPVALMRHYLTGNILGTHPVFGPGAASLSGQNFILTPCNDQSGILADQSRDWLSKRGAQVRLMSPAEHDELMAVVLGLAHFIAIVAGDTLSQLKPISELKNIGGITFKVLSTLVESVLSEDPSLYGSLQMNLPRLPEMEALFAERAKTWAEIVEMGHKDKFIAKMSELKTRLEKENIDFGQAYRNMYRISDM